MNKRFGRRVIGKLTAAAIAAVGTFALAAQPASAGLMVDLRAASINGQSLPAGSTEHSVHVLAGDEVSINIFAVVTGTNDLNDEGFRSVHGAFHSTTGGLLGNLTGSAVIVPFNQAGSQNGSSVDFDGDGDLDIGTTPIGGTATTFWIPSSAATFQTDGSVVAGAQPAAEEFSVGSVTFTALTDDGETFINFFNRRTSSGSDSIAFGSWQEDELSKNPVTSAVTANGITIVGIPEPTGLTFAALGTLGFVARRQRKPDAANAKCTQRNIRRARGSVN